MRNWLILLVCLVAINSQAQHYVKYGGAGNTLTSVTTYSNVKDTTDYFPVYYSTSRARVGDPCFVIYVANIGVGNTKLDTLHVILRGTDKDTPDKAESYWYKIEAVDLVRDSTSSLVYIADTLNYISAQNVDLIYWWKNGISADSATTAVAFIGDKSAAP
jgi:hypothetical protein